MAISKTLLLAFLFSVTLLIVSDVSARELPTPPFSTQQTQPMKLNDYSNGDPVTYGGFSPPYPIGYGGFSPPNPIGYGGVPSPNRP